MDKTSIGEADFEGVRNSLEQAENSRDKYVFLFDHAPVGYLTFDREGRIRAANLTGANLLGMERADLLGQHFEKFVADDDCFVFSRFTRTVFASQKKETCRLMLAESNPEPLCVRIEALVTPAGDECLAVLVDITEKKRAEKALSESEYNLAKAQSMTRVGSWSYDATTGEVQASAELLKIMRLQPDQTNHEMFASMVHPEDRTVVLDHLTRGIELGTKYEIEHRLLFSDGTLRWVYTIVEPAVNSAGVVLKLYGTTQDVTQRKQGEVDLQNKTNELQAIFDSIGDGISVYDQDALLQHHNLISPQLFPQSTFAGAPCQAVFHPDIPCSPQQCPVEKALQGERVDTSLVFVNGDHHSRYIDVTATPIKDAMGEKNRALVFFRDVSAKRLQEIRLIHTEKMSSVGVLATGIAHEINNPLTSVAGCAEALLRRFRDAPELLENKKMVEFPHYLETITREAYRCKGIIDHLLSFGRKTDGTAGKVDINSALVEIIELLRHQTRYQQIPVVSHRYSGLPRVRGDSSGLRQVFMNLLVNALQSIEGAGKVEVTTAMRDNDTVTIMICDSGCGMSQSTIDRIWEPFFTTKEVGQGVGLGLALTYNIVKEHGGEISLESCEGVGSKFTVHLPIWQ